MALDMCVRLHAEYKPMSSLLNVVLDLSRCFGTNGHSEDAYEPGYVDVEEDRITFRRAASCVVFHLPHVQLFPASCRGLRWSSASELHLSLQAQEVSQQGRGLKVEQKDGVIQNVVVEAEEDAVNQQDVVVNQIQQHQHSCLCTGCGRPIFSSKSLFKRVLPLPSENWSDFADIWFCHNHSHHHSGETQTQDVNTSTTTNTTTTNTNTTTTNTNITSNTNTTGTFSSPPQQQQASEEKKETEQQTQQQQQHPEEKKDTEEQQQHPEEKKETEEQQQQHPEEKKETEEQQQQQHPEEKKETEEQQQQHPEEKKETEEQQQQHPEEKKETEEQQQQQHPEEKKEAEEQQQQHPEEKKETEEQQQQHPEEKKETEEQQQQQHPEEKKETEEQQQQHPEEKKETEEQQQQHPEEKKETEEQQQQHPEEKKETEEQQQQQHPEEKKETEEQQQQHPEEKKETEEQQQQHPEEKKETEEQQQQQHPEEKKETEEQQQQQHPEEKKETEEQQQQQQPPKRLSPRRGDCLVGSLYLLVHSGQVCPSTVGVTPHTQRIVCRRCGNFMGFVQEKGESSGSDNPTESGDDVYKIYLHAVSFFNPETFSSSCSLGDSALQLNKVPKDQNGSLSQGLVEDFLCKLFRDQSKLFTSFRFIIQSSHEEHADNIPIVLLVWLLDQHLEVFSSDCPLPAGSSKTHESQVSRTHVFKFLYKASFRSAKENRQSSKAGCLFKMWERDNTVHGLDLPYPLCKQLLSLLIASTKQLSPSQRCLNSFHVGYLCKKQPSQVS